MWVGMHSRELKRRSGIREKPLLNPWTCKSDGDRAGHKAQTNLHLHGVQHPNHSACLLDTVTVLIFLKHGPDPVTLPTVMPFKAFLKCNMKGFSQGLS